MTHPRPGSRAVLLDVDGTLLDSNDAHTLSWIETLERRGMHFSYEAVRPLIGMGGDKLLPCLTGLAADDPALQGISAQRTQLFVDAYLPELSPTPRARALVEMILASGLQAIVATSAGAELAALLRQAEVDDLIPMAAGSHDAPRSKPDADIVQAALAKAGVPAQQAVLIGDTPYDAQAAHGAGVAMIALRCGGWWDDDELSEADAIYQDPAQLLDLWDRSLLATPRLRA